MKSQVSVLLPVMRGLLADVRAAYPALKGLDFDFERLSLYCQTRGLTLFTLDLPNLDSLLLRGLESGRLTLEGPLSHAVSKRTKVPRLFSGLWLRVFDRDACLKQEVDATAVAFLRQLCCLGKKLRVECSTNRITAVMENYYGIERDLRRPSLDWESDDFVLGWESTRINLCDAAPNSEPTSDLFSYEPGQKAGSSTEEKEAAQECRELLNKVQQVADLILGSFEHYDPVALSELLESNGQGIGFKHGPGAVAERVKQHEKSCFLNWPAKLEFLFPWQLVGKTAGMPLSERPRNHEVASRLMSVPKTAKGPRLIASEPSSHQWCQQQMRWFINNQLRNLFGTSFIDFNDQHKSGNLVLRASRDRKLATVDLSDASDRLSCWTVERIFRKNPSLLCHLHAARTRYLVDEVSPSRNFLRIKKFATQGTATTFPVQSLVFLCIALGCSIKGRINWTSIGRMRNQVRVYGDDIIIPTHGYVPLLAVMNALQLKVNAAKSYVNGNFRESCGTDGYLGYDVTPVKPEVIVADNPASCQAVVDTSNNLFNKGYWNASDSLLRSLPARLQRGIRIVDQNEAGFAGLSSFSGSDESHLAKRWNSRLHRDEVRVWTLLSPTAKRDRQGFPAMLDFVASVHNHEHARIVSEYGESRKARDGFLWEPSNTDARAHVRAGDQHFLLNARISPKRLDRHRRRGRCSDSSRVRK